MLIGVTATLKDAEAMKERHPGSVIEAKTGSTFVISLTTSMPCENTHDWVSLDSAPSNQPSRARPRGRTRGSRAGHRTEQIA